MGHNLKLSPFKEIFKSTLVFYKANWKSLVSLFIPLEIIILVSFICLDFIPESGSLLSVVIFMTLTIVAFVATSFSKLLVLDAPRIVEKVVFGEKIPQVKAWYMSLVRKIIPLSIVMILVAIANFAFIFLVVMSAGFIFFLASLLTKGLPENSITAIVLVVATSVVILYTTLRFVVRFFVGGVFSVYLYVFEEKRGLDALTGSFLLTEGKRFSLFWRIVGIWIVTSIPFVLLVFPIQVSIVIDNFASAYQSFLMREEPVLLEPSLFVSVMLNIFTSIASLVSTSLFIVFNYFLWKDLKATASPFEEVKYTKMRKNLRSLVGAGILILILMFVSALFFGASSF